MAGIRQVQLTELDLGLGVVLLPGTLVCKPSSIHMAENCSRPVFSVLVCPGHQAGQFRSVLPRRPLHCNLLQSESIPSARFAVTWLLI